MSVATAFYMLLETCIGRKRMWRLTRRLYLAARRDGSLDFENNGEYTIIRRLAEWSRESSQPLLALDIGANRGLWTDELAAALAAANAPRASIVAFEPVPALADKLKQKAATGITGADLKIVQSALSSSEGVTHFIVTEGGGDHHLAARDFAFEGKRIDARVTTIDAWCASNGIDYIDFVKIDAEGFDPLVIQGAKRMLTEERIALIQFEYGVPYIRSRTYLYDVFQLVAGTRYKIGRLTQQGVELLDSWHFDMERFYGSNYVIVHDTARNRIPCRDVAYDATNTYA
jgi:FkbM family methyltransferase